MNPYGHIKISRKVFDPDEGDVWWLEPRVLSKWEAWEYMIQLAQWQPRDLNTKYGVIHLKRGEFVASIRDLSKRFRWGVQATRGFLGSAQKLTRLATQRETQAGTVYLIVNYDTYQGTTALENTPSNTPANTAPTQRQHKNKQLKQLKQLTTPASADTVPQSHDQPTSKYPSFPMDLCQRLYDAWVKQRGSVQFGAFRKALAPLFPAAGALYSESALVEAIAVSAEYVAEMEDRDARFETIHTFAQRIGEWVRLGKLPMAVDGILTERGQHVGSRALRQQQSRRRIS